MCVCVCVYKRERGIIITPLQLKITGALPKKIEPPLILVYFGAYELIYLSIFHEFYLLWELNLGSRYNEKNAQKLISTTVMSTMLCSTDKLTNIRYFLKIVNDFLQKFCKKYILSTVSRKCKSRTNNSMDALTTIIRMQRVMVTHYIYTYSSSSSTQLSDKNTHKIIG